MIDNIRARFSDTKKTVTTITSTLVFLGSIVGGVLFVDDRYAHAGEVQQLRAEQSQSVIQMRIETKKIRRAALDDKVFEIELKDKKTDTDKALMERAKREMDLIDQEIAQLQAQVK